MLTDICDYVDSGETISRAIYRLADQVWYDFADGTFKALTPGMTQLGPMLELAAPLQRSYMAVLVQTTAAQFPDGEYCSFYTLGTGGVGGVIGHSFHVMRDGDEAPVFLPQSFAVNSFTGTLSGLTGAGQTSSGATP